MEFGTEKQAKSRFPIVEAALVKFRSWYVPFCSHSALLARCYF